LYRKTVDESCNDNKIPLSGIREPVNVTSQVSEAFTVYFDNTMKCTTVQL